MMAHIKKKSEDLMPLAVMGGAVSAGREAAPSAMMGISNRIQKI